MTEYCFNSCDDRHTRIHCVRWEPQGKPIAVLQLVHGMQEHIERYSEFAGFLTERGFVVAGHDHIGHGDSVDTDSDRGIMHTAHPADTMVNDIFTHYRYIRTQYPGIPYFILGHSMGSYLLRQLLSSKNHSLSDINGAILIGSGTESDAEVLIGITLLRLFIALKGRDYRSPYIRKHMFRKNYRRFDLEGKVPENSWLSKNVESVRAFFDPDNKKDFCEFSLNGYLLLLESIWHDNRITNIKRMNKYTPILFASGDQDPVGAMGTGVIKAYDKFKQAGINDITMKLYPGDRHEILNELDRGLVYSDLYDWMSVRMH